MLKRSMFGTVLQMQNTSEDKQSLRSLKCLHTQTRRPQRPTRLVIQFDANEILLEEAFVVVHLELAFDLAHGVKGNADHDEDGGAAKR